MWLWTMNLAEIQTYLTVFSFNMSHMSTSIHSSLYELQARKIWPKKDRNEFNKLQRFAYICDEKNNIWSPAVGHTKYIDSNII